MNKYFSNYYQEKAVIKLINKHFWKSKVGPISSLVLPLFLMIVYAIISTDNKSMLASGLSSFFSFSILPVALITLPQMMVELKSSIILRKISVSKITASKFSTILLIYYLIAIIISNIIILTLYATFLNVDAPKYFSEINWGEFFYTLIVIYIISLSAGLLLGVLIKKISLVLLIGFIVMMVSVIFSGQFMPLIVLAKSEPIRYISLFSPISYALNFMNNVVVSTNSEYIKIWELLGYVPIKEIPPAYEGIFDFKHSFNVYDIADIPVVNTGNYEKKIYWIEVYRPWQNILNFVMPYLFSMLFIFISIKKFNWTSR